MAGTDHSSFSNASPEARDRDCAEGAGATGPEHPVVRPRLRANSVSTRPPGAHYSAGRSPGSRRGVRPPAPYPTAWFKHVYPERSQRAIRVSGRRHRAGAAATTLGSSIGSDRSLWIIARCSVFGIVSRIVKQILEV